MNDLFVRTDRKRRCLLRMKGTERLEIAAGPLQRDILRYYLNNIIVRVDEIDLFWRIECHIEVPKVR
jgi:hypothetical protein